MKTDWRVFTVQELVNEGLLDEPLDGNHGELHPKTSDYVSSGVPFIMANDILNGRVNYSSCSFISEQQSKTLRKGFARFNDVLLTHKATIGRTALVGDEYSYIVLTPQVTYYRAKNGIIPRYLKYYFDSPDFQRLFAAWAGGGSTRAYLGILAQRKLPIVIPPLETQKKIAAVLGALDDKIELNRKMNANLEAQAQALFKSWFVDFTPFGGKMPKDWKLVSFEKIAFERSEKGSSHDVEMYSVTNTGIHARNDIFNKNLNAKNTPCKLLYKGDLVFGMSRKILNWGVMRSDCGGVSSAYNVYEMSSEIDMVYLERYIENHINEFTALIKPASREGQGFDKQKFLKMQMIIPTKHVLMEFHTKYDAFARMFNTNALESRKLAELRDTLLPKLMKGEISVSL